MLRFTLDLPNFFAGLHYQEPNERKQRTLLKLAKLGIKNLDRKDIRFTQCVTPAMDEYFMSVLAPILQYNDFLAFSWAACINFGMQQLGLRQREGQHVFVIGDELCYQVAAAGKGPTKIEFLNTGKQIVSIEKSDYLLNKWQSEMGLQRKGKVGFLVCNLHYDYPPANEIVPMLAQDADVFILGSLEKVNSWSNELLSFWQEAKIYHQADNRILESAGQSVGCLIRIPSEPTREEAKERLSAILSTLSDRSEITTEDRKLNDELIAEIRTLRIAKQHKEAFEKIEELVSDFKGEPTQLCIEAANLCYESNNPEMGILWIETALKFQPSNFWANLAYGLLLISVANFEDAEIALQKATEIDPANLWGFAHLGFLYKMTARYAEAAIQFSIAEKISADSTESLRWKNERISCKSVVPKHMNNIKKDMKVISFGSCMSNITAKYLVADYGFVQTHNVANNRSDQFIKYFIDRSARQIPVEYFDDLLVHKHDMEKTARQILRNQYEEYVGFHELLDRKMESNTTFFEDLSANEYDVIIMDNLMDISFLLMYPNELPDYHDSPLLLNCHFYENRAEVARKFTPGNYLEPVDSAKNWIRIIRWIKELQPCAKIVFLCYHFVTSLSEPVRYNRIRDFYTEFTKLSKNLNIDVIPPLLVPKEMTKGESDWTHFEMPVYRALASYVFLRVAGGLPQISDRYQLPPSVHPVITTSTSQIDAPTKTLPENQSPYAKLPDSSFWRRAVAKIPAEDVDPITNVLFTISRNDAIATAGSCFSQHISKMLVDNGFFYLVTETAPTSSSAANENFGVFPARFGNIYTTRQLLQLFLRAYNKFKPVDNFWTCDGSFVDPFRPKIQECGFSTLDALEEDRSNHMAAVRQMFERCNVFIFTLGLTEAWASTVDGAVFPLPPGVAGAAEDPNLYEFVNFGVTEMISDLVLFIKELRFVNPFVKVILTVSPVPLIATYEPKHVLVATAYSKAALRVVAETVEQQVSDVMYFPSYEIITGVHTRARYIADDLREVTPEGVARVMSIFKKHYLITPEDLAEAGTSYHSAVKVNPLKSELSVARNDTFSGTLEELAAYERDLHVVICEEIAIDP